MKTSSIKAIIIDDEQRCIANLSYYLSKYCPAIEIVAASNTINGAADLLQYHKPDVAFLDIEICNDNIFSLINSSDKLSFEIVFVTAYEKYAVQAFKVEALDYIVKPLSKTDILDCYQKILKRWHHMHPVENAIGQQTEPVLKKVILKRGEHVYIVKQSDIYYFKAKGFYTEVFFNHKDEVLSTLISKPISTLEKDYDHDLFFRLHKSYLVNVKRVSNMIKGDNAAVKLVNDEVLPVAKRRINDLLSFLNK